MDTELDYLGNGFKNIKINLPNDIDGEQHATLIYRKANIDSNKAILYVHGFIDYFYQTELADTFNEWGYNFYAVDLRKYGRSLMPNHHPNFISDIKEYFVEFDKSIEIIKSQNNSSIIMMGHSTGGLSTPLYAHYKNNIDGLILNSPFFALNIPPFLNSLMPLVSAIGKKFPYMTMDALTEHYPKSLHKDYKGEWDFRDEWKPIKNFPAYLGWLRAIRNAQKELQNGLDIKCPTLVMYSDKSYKGKKWDDIIKTSDGVLDVEHIKKYADGIGNNITKVEIKDGIHDLILSKKDIRDNAYSSIKQWLDNNNL